MKKMMKCIAVVLSVLFLFSSSYCMASATLESASQNALAPAFSLKTMKGNTVALSDMKGKNVLLFFFATWCPWCRNKIPDLVKNEARYKKDNLEFLLIDAGESQAKVSSFAEKQDVPFDILLDQDMKVSQDYDVVGVPTFVLISKDGRIVYSGNEMPADYRKLIGE